MHLCKSSFDRILAPLLVGVAALFLIPGCGKEVPEAAPPPPAQVTALTTQPETIDVIQTYLGRVGASNSVQVRARIQGIVEKTHFTEGSSVEKGDLLYTIESDVYAAALSQAKAQLASAQAEADRATAFEQRMARLIGSEAISQQDYDNAASAANQAVAAVEAAQSLVDRAELDLGFTRILAPAAGRIGKSLTANGALVGRDGPTHVATIDQIDPIEINFTISDLDALKIRQLTEAGVLETEKGRGEVEVILPDGSVYDQVAMVDFSARLVNAETGTVMVRAKAANPEARLLPGMFVRAKLNVGQRSHVILLPQEAVIKVPTGHVAWVVKDGKAERRDLVMGAWYGERWIVEKGIGPGESVIVDGAQALSPGRAVTVQTIATSAAKSATRTLVSSVR
jgi:membrane fusion protein (multidrug efflux system)